MHHAMFDAFIEIFHCVVRFLRDAVRGDQGEVLIAADLDIHVDAVAEDARLDVVHAQHALDGEQRPSDFVIEIPVAGFIHHFSDRLAEDIDGGARNEQTDDEGGDDVENGIAAHPADDSDEDAEGGKYVYAVVPGARLQRYGVDGLRFFDGVPVEGFLHRYGDGDCRDRQRIRLFRLHVRTVDQFFYPRISDREPRPEQQNGEQNGDDAFQPFVTVGMIVVDWF